MNYDQMTISEMEEIYSRLGEEIEKRREAEAREDWNKLANQIRLFIERHGPIDIQHGGYRLFYVDSDTDLSELGVIYISEY